MDLDAVPLGEDLLEFVIKDLSQFTSEDFCHIFADCQIFLSTLKYSINPPQNLGKQKFSNTAPVTTSLGDVNPSNFPPESSGSSGIGLLDNSTGSTCSFHTAQSSLSQPSSARSSLEGTSDTDCQKTPTRVSLSDDALENFDPGTLKKSSTPVASSAILSPQTILNQTFENEEPCQSVVIPCADSDSELPLNATFESGSLIHCDLGDTGEATPCADRTKIKKKSALKLPSKLPPPATTCRRILQPINIHDRTSQQTLNLNLTCNQPNKISKIDMVNGERKVKKSMNSSSEVCATNRSRLSTNPPNFQSKPSIPNSRRTIQLPKSEQSSSAMRPPPSRLPPPSVAVSKLSAGIKSSIPALPGSRLPALRVFRQNAMDDSRLSRPTQKTISPRSHSSSK